VPRLDTYGIDSSEDDKDELEIATGVTSCHVLYWTI
jgi:hypothetical protein